MIVERRRQRLLGCVASAFLAVALLALVDGLQARMRADTNNIDCIPGQMVALSGPTALKNPLASDVIARFVPESAPFQFALEGFFTGYWFGSGMWRGELRCDADATAGEYAFNLNFRGSGAQSAQKYRLRVYADADALRADSGSVLHRFAHINPFLWAAGFGACGLLCGLATYFFGWRLAHRLRRLGLAEVYARQGDIILCLSRKALAPGTLCRVIDETGSDCGEARVIDWIKGKIRLSWPARQPLPSGALVRLRRPED